MKKAIGTTSIVIGVVVGIFLRLDLGLAIDFVGALLVSAKLLPKLIEKRN
jgi:hypothetical protein